jgi:cytochrome P450
MLPPAVYGNKLVVETSRCLCEGATVDDRADELSFKDRSYGVGVVADPYPELAVRRAQAAAHVGAFSAWFGVDGPEQVVYGSCPHVSVLSYKGVETVVKDDATYSSSWLSPMLGEVVGRSLLEMDGDEHQRMRRLLQPAFTKREADRWEHDYARPAAVRKLEAIQDRGRADLVADFLFTYPVEVILSALGLPLAERDTFYRLAVLLTNPLAAADARGAASARIAEIVRALIAERRVHPGTDLISLLASSSVDGDRMSDDEIVTFCRLLLPAGAQTTFRALANIFFALLDDPTQLDAVRADHALIPRAVEEGLRWEPPMLATGRMAAGAADLEGMPVVAGCSVNILFGAANRDPARWREPERFDVHRAPKGHLGFGGGSHICLGISTARMEMRVAIEEVLERLPGLALDPAAPRPEITGLGFRNPTTLPVVFDALP